MSARSATTLASDTETDDEVREYLRDMAGYALLTEDEERRLAERSARGDLAARERLICCNWRWVVSIAEGFVGHGWPLMDLIQEGNIGLTRAADKFDYRRGFRFTTYATWWIRQSIGRAVSEWGGLIHVPTYIATEAVQMERASRQLAVELGRDPTLEEVAARTQFSVERLLDLQRWTLTVASLDAPLERSSNPDEQCLADFLMDSETPDLDDQVDQQLLSKRINAAIAELEETRDQAVIRMRYGIGDERRHTLQETGDQLHITRERARQLENRAKKQLRGPLERMLEEWEGVA